eukprot:300814-Pyramimonas_sp.AAC.1
MAWPARGVSGAAWRQARVLRRRNGCRAHMLQTPVLAHLTSQTGHDPTINLIPYPTGRQTVQSW